ncbi:unnamed protein product [Closterium sp. NIES-53]
MHEGGRQSTDLKERVCRTWCMECSLCIVELYGGIGTGLAAALKAGCFVGRWLHVERDPFVRKMARNYALKLLEEYPQQMLITAIPLEEEVTVHNVWDITEQQLEAWGLIDLVVAGWECKGEPVRRAYEEITEELGRGVPIDAAQLGSRAHRPRRGATEGVADPGVVR